MKNLQYLIKFKPYQRELFQSAATHTIPSIIFKMLKEASKWQKQKQKQQTFTNIIEPDTKLKLLKVYRCDNLNVILVPDPFKLFSDYKF